MNVSTHASSEEPSVSGDLVIFSQVFPPDPTAVGQYLLDAAREMQRRGFRVTVYTANRAYEDPGVRFPRHEDMQGIAVRRLPLSSFGKKSLLIRLLGGVSFTLQCALHGLLRPRTTHLLVSTSPPMCPLAAVIVGVFRRVRIAYWAMDINPDQSVAMGAVKPGSLFVRLLDGMNRQILRRATTVVALDHFMADRLNRKRDVRDKLAVIPPWPQEHGLRSVEHAENPFRQRHGLDGKLVVMYSGNLSNASPITSVLRAAERLRDLPELVFLFVGGGQAKREIDELIAREAPPNVRSLPYQPFSELSYSLSAADVHLVSVGEKIVGICHPCKVYGAMAVARPIVLLGPEESHVGDLLQRARFGWHIPPDDVDAAERVLREIAASTPQQRAALGQQGRRLVDQELSQAALCRRFGDLVEHGPPPR